MTARVLDYSPGEYHRDPLETPSLSQSIAHTLISKTPLHAWSEHPRLGNQRREPTKAMNAGQIIHRHLLGKGGEFEVIQADNYRTKLAQEQRDEALASHRIPVLQREHEEYVGMLETIQANVQACGIHLTGESEVQIAWEEAGSLGPVLCRGMLDHVLVDQGIIYDVKKCESAHPRAISRSMMSYGYPIQHAAYCSALAKLRPDLEGRIDFVFVFIEIEPPYAVFAGRPNGMLRELGDMQWGRAVRLWEHCLATNTWNGYGPDIGVIEAPAWAMSAEMMEG
jgi:PDDEXK-like domain of unknown function (DUF3799)